MGEPERVLGRAIHSAKVRLAPPAPVAQRPALKDVIRKKARKGRRMAPKYRRLLTILPRGAGERAPTRHPIGAPRGELATQT
jgi:hypothetical protein